MKAPGAKGYFGGHDFKSWSLYCSGNPCEDFTVYTAKPQASRILQAMKEDDDLDADSVTKLAEKNANKDQLDAQNATEQFNAAKNAVDDSTQNINAYLPAISGRNDSSVGFLLNGGFPAGATVELTEDYRDPESNIVISKSDRGIARKNGIRPNEVLVEFDHRQFSKLKFIFEAGHDGFKNSTKDMSVSVPINKLKPGQPFAFEE
jgi:hypothetical protein